MVLLGDPVAHSRSPQLHNAAFAADGLNWAYLACHVAPGAVEAAVGGLRALSIAGANVTAPHKEAIVPLLDALAESASAVGAVNTVVRDGDRLTGHNTDVEGFLGPLIPHQHRLQGTEMVVLGAGGAARAAAFGLLRTFSLSRLTLAARTPDRAEGVARVLAAYDPASALAVVPLPEARPAVRRARLVVHATPVGMQAMAADTPWPHAGDFGPDHIVYDLIYQPRPTRLLREAAAHGAHTLDGWPMLVGQAAAAYRLWTGRPMPATVIQSFLDTPPQ